MNYEVEQSELDQPPYLPLEQITDDDIGRPYLVIYGEPDMVAVYAGNGEFYGISSKNKFRPPSLVVGVHYESPNQGSLRTLGLVDSGIRILPVESTDFCKQVLGLVIDYYQNVVNEKIGTPAGLTLEQAESRLQYYLGVRYQ